MEATSTGSKKASRTIKPAAASKERTWTKNHPLEGDGLLVNFYNHMWKKNKEFQSCPGVRCPDTIVYDHNFPRGWYTYDQKNHELKKKQGKELDTSSLLASFSRSSDPCVDIVASYLFSYEQDTGEAVTSIEFFTDKDLGEFLNNRKTKKEGILQKFLIPKGLNNNLIQAVWSPRVCIVQRKTNRHAIIDRSYSAYERAVTYEGPSHYTEDGICAPKTTSQIKSICGNICQHFQNTEHKNITRMVLYFKVDKNDQVWLLWCGSIRISDRQHQSQMPLNLSPIFTSPEQSSQGHNSDFDTNQDVLLDVDRHQYALSGDVVFKKSHCSPPVSPTKVKMRAEKVVHTETEIMLDSDEKESKQETQQAKEEEWWLPDTHIHEQYKQILEEQELVTTMFGDVFYEAYSHFLRHDSGGFLFSLPVQVKHLLGENSLDLLLAHLKINPVPQDKLAKLTRGMGLDLGLDFWISDAQHQPISKLGMECQTWIRKYYANREDALRRVAMGEALAQQDDNTVLLGTSSLLPERAAESPVNIASTQRPSSTPAEDAVTLTDSFASTQRTEEDPEEEE
jgi:hypothetical protein